MSEYYQNIDTEEDVEKEDIGESTINEPYDPNKIKIDTQNVNLGFLLEKLEYKEIDLMPDFQREGNLWSKTKQSQLIESILLGLPLPSFYFSETSKKDANSGDVWQVVDGLQRLSTLKAFWVDKTLKLEGLEFLHDYKTKSYNDLSRADLRKISGFKVNLYIIEQETPKQAKFLIFKRVNTGGLVLKPQEMRHALNQGIPADFIKELSLLESFKTATDHKIPSKRQEDRDFVNRFIAFYLLGTDTYNGELDPFLNDGMGLLYKTTEKERKAIKKVFESAMKTSLSVFEKDTFRKRFDIKDKRKPISKSLYDTISVNIAWLTDDERKALIDKKEIFKDKLMKLMNEDEKFLRSISTGTGQKSNVTKRFSAIKQVIEDVLNIRQNNRLAI